MKLHGIKASSCSIYGYFFLPKKLRVRHEQKAVELAELLMDAVVADLHHAAISCGLYLLPIKVYKVLTH